VLRRVKRASGRVDAYAVRRVRALQTCGPMVTNVVAEKNGRPIKLTVSKAWKGKRRWLQFTITEDGKEVIYRLHRLAGWHFGRRSPAAAKAEAKGRLTEVAFATAVDKSGNRAWEVISPGRAR